MATINQEDLQSIVSAVLSSIRTNSRTIEQLTPVTSLNDSDSIEVGGGKRITYGTLKQLILQLEPLLNAIDNAKITSAKVTVAEASATLTISEGEKDISASIPIVSQTASGLMSAEDKKTLTKLDCVGKAGGIAPLGSNRMVPSRYMLPELYNVVEFDGLDDTAASEIGFAEGDFQAPVDEEYETHIVWLSAIGRFAAMFRRKEGVGALSLDSEDASARAAGAATEAGGTVGGVETGGGAIATGKYYKGWGHSERYCDEEGKPLAGKLYRSYGDGALYAATRDCQDLERLYDDMLAAARRQVFRDLWRRRCFGHGDSDEEGQSFTYLDITLTYEEALLSYIVSANPASIYYGFGLVNVPERLPVAILPIYVSSYGNPINLSAAFRAQNRLRRVVLRDKNRSGNWIAPTNLSQTFYDCYSIDKLELDLSNITAANGLSVTFANCRSLSDVKLKGLKYSVDLHWSPNITVASLQYLIANAANTAAITVTVHSSVYARIMDEGSGDWHALLAAASAKNISFATI